MKRVLFATSEAFPFAKTGGLADVAGSLPAAFDRSEYDVRVIMPKYGSIPNEYCEQMRFICSINVSLGWRNKYCGIFELNYGGVIYYFIDNEFYFSGTTIYSYIHEDVEKFAFFSKAVLSILPHIDLKPDIVHCNDWQTGLVPIMLNVLFRHDSFYSDIKTIMTIHNLRFQGIWGIAETQDATGLPNSCFTHDKLEFYGDANLLKGGIVYADHVTTVSNNYMEEIQTPYYGERLDGLLRARKDSLTGIVNGISYTEYDPTTDNFIYAKYDRRDFPGRKRENKIALQRELGLSPDKKKFLVGVVSRLTDQKGLPLIEQVMGRFVERDIQLVVVGTGETGYENMFKYYASQYPGLISSNILFSNELAHKIYAAADAFLMPSQFEPCGLSQLIAMRYGAVPIVRETGGLKETVIPFNEYSGEGTGFSFKNYDAEEMWNAIQYAREIYNDRTVWNSIARRGMAQDFSWEKSAAKYADLYTELLK